MRLLFLLQSYKIALQLPHPPSSYLERGQCLAKIPSQCPNLRSLGLGKCKKASSNTITEILTKCTQLQELELFYLDNLTDDHIALIPNCKNITAMDLSLNPKVTSAAIGKAVAKLPHLARLEIERVSTSFLSSLFSLIKENQHKILKRWRMGHCQKLPWSIFYPAHRLLN